MANSPSRPLLQIHPKALQNSGNAGAQRTYFSHRICLAALVLRCNCAFCRLGLDGYVDFGSRLQLDFLSVVVDQSIGNSNLFVQVIRTLDRNLRLFRLPALWVRTDNFFDPAGKCSDRFRSTL